MKKLVISLLFVSSLYSNSYVDKMLTSLKWVFIPQNNHSTVATPGMPTVKRLPFVYNLDWIRQVLFSAKKPKLYPVCFPKYKVTEENIVKLAFPL